MKPEISALPEHVRMMMQRRARRALRKPGQWRSLRKRSDINEGLVRHGPKRRRTPRWVKAVIVVLVACAVFLSVFSYLLVRDLDDKISQRRIDLSQFQEKPRQLVDDYSGRAVNIAILGSDTREGAGNEDFGEEGEDYGMRSDTAIVAHISADRTRLQFVSIPRDTLVDMPACELPDGSMTSPGFYQFNAAFSFGGGPQMNLASAVACTQKTIESFTGLMIDEVVVVDFAGFEQLVDALGGIRMCIEEDIEDEKAGLSITKGCQRIDGATALGLARSRYSTEDGSDISRIGRQQDIMMNIVNTALNKSLLTDLPTLYNFVQKGIESIQTTPGLSRVSSVAGLAQSIRNIPTSEYQFVTMPWVPSSWDENRVEMAAEAVGVWEALKNDVPFPEGTRVKAADGSEGVVDVGGTVVPEPSDEPTATVPEE